MDAEEGFFGLGCGAVDCHWDGWVVVFEADELVAPEHSDQTELGCVWSEI